MKVQPRMAFHFTYQLFIFSLLIFIAMLVLILVIINQIANDEMKRNFPSGALDPITTEATYTNGKISLAAHWKELMEERNTWLQVISTKGDVVYSLNTKEELPASYSVTQLLSMQREGTFGPYLVNTQLDQTYEEPLLFVLGYQNPQKQMLAFWYENYQQEGLVPEDKKEELLLQLQEKDSYLFIMDAHGESIQILGDIDNDVHSYEPLEILAMEQMPGNYDTTITAYQSADSALTWILYAPNQTGAFSDRPILQEFIRVFIWVGCSILLLSLIISIWHGYRYGQPLLLFIGWFERMGRGQYGEVLTPKDRRRVFRKNGKLRVRYRLYREVIQSFYQMAEQLAQTEKDRLQLEKTREEWMSGISHDLRTPLSTIQGYAHILENSPADWSSEELQDMGRMIRKKGDYMLGLITDFSHIFQLKQSSILMDRQEVELGELVRRAVLKYVNNATITEVNFQYEGSEHPVTIIGNEMWLQRLMDNLLSNAVKHNEPGITVTITSNIINGQPFIRVSDNGRGMNEETRQKLFERYYRGTNTEETSAGSGLGMSIAKMIVEAHHGRIEVHSEPGAGTTITIYFPSHALSIY